jgi:hypothetical protein
MDISYDSTTIITGGADRNIKIWGSVGTQQMISDLKN